MTHKPSLPPELAEMVVNKPYYAEIEGRAIIELRNGDTGKLEHRQEASNFLGKINDEYFAWIQREVFFRYCPNRGTSKYARRPIDGMQQHFACWSDNRVEDRNTQFGFEGDLIAYANRGTYSGSDTKRGTLNIFSDTYVNNDAASWVFDWPTYAGNSGSFQTVGWTTLFEKTNDALQNAAFVSLSVEPKSVPNNGNLYGGFVHDGQNWCFLSCNFHGTSNTNAWAADKAIYKIGPTGNYVGKVSYTHNLGFVGSNAGYAAAVGLAWDGVHFWHGEAWRNSSTVSAGKLWRAPATDGAGVLHTVPNCGPITAIAYDNSLPGGRLYIFDGYNDRVYRSPRVFNDNGSLALGSTITPEATLALQGGTLGPRDQRGAINSEDGNVYPSLSGFTVQNLGNEGSFFWVMNGTTSTTDPGSLTRYNGSMNIVARAMNGTMVTQNQAGLAGGTAVLTSQLGHTCVASTRPGDLTYISGHSTFQQEDAFPNTAKPMGPIYYSGGVLHALTDDNKVRVLGPWSLGTRVRMTQPITKTNLQTMRIRYNFSFI